MQISAIISLILGLLCGLLGFLTSGTLAELGLMLFGFFLLIAIVLFVSSLLTRPAYNSHSPG